MKRALQMLTCFLLVAPAMAAADQWVQARSVLRAMAPAGAEVVFAAPSGRTPGADRACHGALEHQVEGARLMPRMTVRFRCLGATGWTEVVSLGWHVYQSVLVTTRPLARQDSVNADTARFERRDLTTLGYGYITDISVLGHRFVARPLQAGVVLTPSMLLHQELVKTGDAVVVQSQTGVW